jgi:hypothetical protein
MLLAAPLLGFEQSKPLGRAATGHHLHFVEARSEAALLAG